MSPQGLTIRQIAEAIGAVVDGDGERIIRGVAALDAAGEGEITFAAVERRAQQLAGSAAAAAVVANHPASAPMPLLRVPHVEEAWARVLALFAPPRAAPSAGIHPDARVDASAEVDATASIGPHAVIEADVRVGPGCVVGPNCVLEAGVVVGAGSVLHAGVVVRHGCRIGQRCEIGPNSVIGHDGFGYYFKDGAHHKVPHIGDVVIEDDVEIGACACVDRAKFGSTRIGAGSKIDNLVQIAHNVQVGRGCILVGQCGIAGSAQLGRFAIVGGSAGVRDHIRLGDQAKLAAYSAAASDVPDGETWAGIPAGPAKEAFRTMMATQKLPELLKRVKELESRIQRLESATDH